MRPYLAVLKDSLREAMASRILWMLTGLITLVLFVGLAPFMLQEEAASRFLRNDFRNGPEFLKLLSAQETVTQPTAACRVWKRLSEPMRKRVREVSAGANINQQVEVLFGVRSELNGMLDDLKLYDATAWPAKTLSDDSRPAIEGGLANLPVEERRHVNRVLIEAAFPDNILPSPAKVLYATWFGYRLGNPLPFEPKQLALLVNYALATLTSILAGVFGVFIAILVTASIVPQTFEPGAIDLLLSKPVSRPLLFLTKFFGATMFILLNTVYLIGGMWLIAGLRFEIWSNKLLFCIPVFMFLFVIYYSISALAGVIWRNAVVSVCFTIIFWFLCFTVGKGKGVVEGTFLDPTRLVTIVPAGEKLLAVNRAGQTFEWSADKQTWEEVFRGRNEGGPWSLFRPSMLGPIYDSRSDRIYAIESMPTRFEFFGGAGKLYVGPRKEDWRRVENTVAPSGAQTMLLDHRGRLVVASLTGIYRFAGDATVEHRAFRVLGVDLAPRDRSARFDKVGPAVDLHWQKPFAAAMNPSDGRLAVVSHGKLMILALDSADKYIVERTLDLKTDHSAIVAFVGGRVALAMGDGYVRIFAGNSLSESLSMRPKGRERPAAIVGSPDGRWLAVLFRDRRLWVYDVQNEAPLPGLIRGQRDISAITFSPAGQFLVSDRFGRVIGYEMEPFQQAASYEPPAETLELLYRYVLTPLYTVFPKPGELDGLVAYLVIGEPIELFSALPSNREDPNRERPAPIDVWQPVWSNLLFLGVMLTITCIYISRRDF